MSKPESIKIEPWTDFPKLPYSFITDDFVYDKLFVGKVNAKGGKSTVNLKAAVGADKNIAEEVKLWFDLPSGRSLYSKLKNNYFRVQLDNGITEQWGQKWNLYAGLSANKSIENAVLRLGVAHLGAKCHTDNRLKVDVNPENRSATWYNRILVTEGKYTFGVLTALGLISHVLVKNNLVFGYQHNDSTSAFLRLLNNGYRKTGFNWSDGSGYFDQVRVDLISSFKDWKYGFEANLNAKGKSFDNAQVVVEHQFNKTTVKASISTDFSAALNIRLPGLLFENIGKTSVGIQGNNLNSEKRSFKYGAQIELNI